MSISDYSRTVLSLRADADKRGVDAKATSIEAFIDIDKGRITLIDNGQGISPDTLTHILHSSGS